MPNQSKPRPSFPSIINTLWFIGFTDHTGPVAWWNWVTRPNFRHIYMYTEIGKGEWLTVSMTRGGLVMTTITASKVPQGIHEFLKETWGGHTVLAANGHVATEIEIPRFAPFTCVELARSLLGIDKMLWTPWQLYRYVLENRLASSIQKSLHPTPAS